MRFWSDLRSLVLALAAALAPQAAGAASLGMLGVTVENRSEPVLCAEKDNVTLTFTAPKVTAFRIEAAHPGYIGSIRTDSFEPDWTACEFKGEAFASKPPQRVTIYEDIELWIVAHRNETNWREAGTRVRIGDKVHDGLHLLQVWVIRPMGGEEVLVVYPQDGYWRMRPKSPSDRAPTAFGSSFLIGPVTQDKGRPVVDIAEIAFDPKARAFTLSFRDGNSATVVLGKLDQERHRLDVTFAKPVVDKPFAALRSMYVTRFNNDVADVAALSAGSTAWSESGIMEFKGARDVTDLWAGRLSPSRHNTSSPDMVLGAFSDGSFAPRAWGDPSKPALATSPAQK